VLISLWLIGIGIGIAHQLSDYLMTTTYNSQQMQSSSSILDMPALTHAPQASVCDMAFSCGLSTAIPDIVDQQLINAISSQDQHETGQEQQWACLSS
jgi:hypothetical protein